MRRCRMAVVVVWILHDFYSLLRAILAPHSDWRYKLGNQEGIMSEVGTRHAEQIAYWNGAGGVHWVAQQERTDLVMSGIAAVALAEADARPGDSVIDVGCGCGTTVQGLAQAVGP